MCPVLIGNFLSQTTHEQKGLQSKGSFDTVRALNKKPPTEAEGRQKEKYLDSTYESDRLEPSTSTLSDASISYNRKDASMSENGFLKIPRTLLNDPKWKSLRVSVQRLFLIIYEHAAYYPKEFYQHGNVIKISPGQLCISYRRLKDLYNRELRFEEDKIDVPFIQRAVSKFAEIGFSIHESIHDITVITITYPDICEYYKNKIDTPFDTQSIHDRYTNKEVNCCSVLSCLSDPPVADLVLENLKQNESHKDNIDGSISNGKGLYLNQTLKDESKAKEKKIVDCSLNMEVLQEKDNESLENIRKITKHYPDGSPFHFSKNDLFHKSVENKADWTNQEVEDLWKVLQDYNEPIRSLFKFCDGVIKNIRKDKKINSPTKPKEEKWKKEKRLQGSDTEPSKKSSPTTKEPFLKEKDTKMHPLANWKSTLPMQR